MCNIKAKYIDAQIDLQIRIKVDTYLYIQYKDLCSSVAGASLKITYNLILF